MSRITELAAIDEICQQRTLVSSPALRDGASVFASVES